MSGLFEMPAAEIAFTSDDCYTPRWLFDAMGLHFNLDVAVTRNVPRAANGGGYDFNMTDGSSADIVATLLRRQLGWLGPNVEVTVLDDGAPTLPAATATGPAQQPIPKGPSQ